MLILLDPLLAELYTSPRSERKILGNVTVQLSNGSKNFIFFKLSLLLHSATVSSVGSGEI